MRAKADSKTPSSSEEGRPASAAPCCADTVPGASVAAGGKCSNAVRSRGRTDFTHVLSAKAMSATSSSPPAQSRKWAVIAKWCACVRCSHSAVCAQTHVESGPVWDAPESGKAWEDSDRVRVGCGASRTLSDSSRTAPASPERRERRGDLRTNLSRMAGERTGERAAVPSFTKPLSELNPTYPIPPPPSTNTADCELDACPAAFSRNLPDSPGASSRTVRPAFKSAACQSVANSGSEMERTVTRTGSSSVVSGRGSCRGCERAGQPCHTHNPSSA
mmetsp:Transcript_30400/g.69634  ORF Transcript_30400/g.69634 Transcript_30400/m.69634 type:complete len:275 (-) Transcript_30400:2248-3072(-)